MVGDQLGMPIFARLCPFVGFEDNHDDDNYNNDDVNDNCNDDDDVYGRDKKDN